MKKNQNMMILDKLVVYRTKSMKNNIVKVPSYLIDMVVLEDKKLMLMSEDVVIITLDKKTIDSRIEFAETTKYQGKLYGKKIYYHLVHIKTLNTNIKSKSNEKLHRDETGPSGGNEFRRL